MVSEAPRWNQVVHSDGLVEGKGGLADLASLWRGTRGYDTVILLGSVPLAKRYRDLVLAALLRWRRPRPRVILTDCTWAEGSATLARRWPLLAPLLPALHRSLVRALDGPHVTYAVLSRAEAQEFPRRWRVDPERVVFTPFPSTVDPDTPRRYGDHAFAGGNSQRRHDLLEEALGDAPFTTVVASRWEPRRPSPSLRCGPVPHEEFVRLLAEARVVVVPLDDADGRSAGQQTYLNAMLLEKPVVVTDSIGVRDYIEDGVTGVVVDADPDALRAAVADAMDPARAEHYRALGQRAREAVLARFTREHYFDEHLLGLAGFPTE